MPITQKGFTLVELLVVISILAILSTIGITTYYNAIRKARDSARMADVEAFSSAFEINKTPSGYKPLQINQFTGMPSKDPTGNAYCVGVGSPQTPNVTTPWQDTCPAGFINITPGQPSGLFSGWKVCAFLEIPSPGSASHAFCLSSKQ